MPDKAPFAPPPEQAHPASDPLHHRPYHSIGILLRSANTALHVILPYSIWIIIISYIVLCISISLLYGL